MRRWRLTAADGVVTWYDEDGFLWRIVDPAGNWLAFDWALAPPTYSDNVVHGLPKHLIRVTDAARSVNYIYDPTKTRLQCVSLGNDCGTQSERSRCARLFQLQLQHERARVGVSRHRYAGRELQILRSTSRRRHATRSRTRPELLRPVARLGSIVPPPMPPQGRQGECVACGNVGLGDQITTYCQNVACYPKGSFPVLQARRTIARPAPKRAVRE